jgi:electron transfer flavoprotein alpha subunit
VSETPAPGEAQTSGEIWTLAEQENGRLRPVSFELLAWGRRLSEKSAGAAPLCSVVLGTRVDRDDLRELILHGADKVYVTEAPALEHFLTEPYAAALEHLIRRRQPNVLLAAATTTGRTVMPYLAIKLNTGLTADCTGLDIDQETGNLIQTRPAIGGNILATIVTAHHRPQMATVRPHSIRPPERDGSRKGEVIEADLPADALSSDVEWLGFRTIEEDDANIQDAERLVSGGRGLKKAENFDLVRSLAHRLDAAVGASRDAVDRGWIPYPHQVGLSGKTVTPRLYVAVGISGAIQHLAGMKTADNIVAINSDPDAQIFQVADFGVVGDLFEFLPALIDEIERRKTRKGRG